MNEPIRDIEILNREFSVEKWTWAIEPDGHIYMYYNEDKLHRAWCDGGCVFAAILSPDRWVDIVNEEDGSWELWDLEPEDMVGVPTAVAIALSCAYTGVPTPQALAREVIEFIEQADELVTGNKYRARMIEIRGPK